MKLFLATGSICLLIIPQIIYGGSNAIIGCFDDLISVEQCHIETKPDLLEPLSGIEERRGKKRRLISQDQDGCSVYDDSDPCQCISSKDSIQKSFYNWKREKIKTRIKDDIIDLYAQGFQEKTRSIMERDAQLDVGNDSDSYCNPQKIKQNIEVVSKQPECLKLENPDKCNSEQGHRKEQRCLKQENAIEATRNQQIDDRIKKFFGSPINDIETKLTETKNIFKSQDLNDDSSCIPIETHMELKKIDPNIQVDLIKRVLVDGKNVWAERKIQLAILRKKSDFIVDYLTKKDNGDSLTTEDDAEFIKTTNERNVAVRNFQQFDRALQDPVFRTFLLDEQYKNDIGLREKLKSDFKLDMLSEKIISGNVNVEEYINNYYKNNPLADNKSSTTDFIARRHLEKECMDNFSEEKLKIIICDNDPPPPSAGFIKDNITILKKHLPKDILHKPTEYVTAALLCKPAIPGTPTKEWINVDSVKSDKLAELIDPQYKSISEIDPSKFSKSSAYKRRQEMCLAFPECKPNTTEAKCGDPEYLKGKYSGYLNEKFKIDTDKTFNSKEIEKLSGSAIALPNGKFLFAKGIALSPEQEQEISDGYMSLYDKDNAAIVAQTFYPEMLAMIPENNTFIKSNSISTTSTKPTIDSKNIAANNAPKEENIPKGKITNVHNSNIVNFNNSGNNKSITNAMPQTNSVVADDLSVANNNTTTPIDSTQYTITPTYNSSNNSVRIKRYPESFDLSGMPFGDVEDLMKRITQLENGKNQNHQRNFNETEHTNISSQNFDDNPSTSASPQEEGLERLSGTSETNNNEIKHNNEYSTKSGINTEEGNTKTGSNNDHKGVVAGHAGRNFANKGDNEKIIPFDLIKEDGLEEIIINLGLLKLNNNSIKFKALDISDPQAYKLIHYDIPQNKKVTIHNEKYGMQDIPRQFYHIFINQLYNWLYDPKLKNRSSKIEKQIRMVAKLVNKIKEVEIRDNNDKEKIRAQVISEEEINYMLMCTLSGKCELK